MQFMVDTVPGNSGVFAMCHVAVDRVPGYATAPTHRPSMEAMTAPGLDRAGNRRFATVKTAAQVPPAVFPRALELTVATMVYHNSNALIKAVVSIAMSLEVFHTVIILSAFSAYTECIYSPFLE